MVASLVFEVINVPFMPEKMFKVVGIIIVLCFVCLVIWSIYQYFN